MWNLQLFKFTMMRQCLIYDIITVDTGSDYKYIYPESCTFQKGPHVCVRRSLQDPLQTMQLPIVQVPQVPMTSSCMYAYDKYIKV